VESNQRAAVVDRAYNGSGGNKKRVYESCKVKAKPLFSIGMDGVIGAET